MAVYGSLATLKSRLKIAPDDTASDADLNKVLAAASGSIDLTCGQSFGLDPEPVTRTLNPRGRVVRRDDGDLLLTGNIGSTTGLVVETGTAGAYTPVTGYETSPDNALLDGRPITGLLRVLGTWGGPLERIRITARWGWPAIPPDIDEASNIQALRLYRRKDSPEGVTSSAEWGVVRLSRRDPDVWNLIEPYVLPGFA